VNLNLFDAALLGLVQGITEFLPISSTAHLFIVQALLGQKDAGAAFTAVLQLGTLLAVIGFFVRDLIGMLAALLDPARRSSVEARTLLYMIAGTVPIGVAGLLLRHAVEGKLRSLTVIAVALIVVGVLMFVVDRRAGQRRELAQISLRDAIIIGCAQMLALVPGVSRSGITLVAGMALGFRRDAAARFSFLLSVPAVAAAGVFELPKALRGAQGNTMPLVVGLAVAAVSGYASIAWLLRFLRSRPTTLFVVYRIALGIALLVGVGLGRL
jgi:undecaprenyl-diphosphatase